MLTTVIRTTLYFLAMFAALVSPANAADPIKIGMSVPLTGAFASGGKVMLLALRIWEEDVNAKGGLLGRPIQIIAYDDQSNGSQVPGIYTKLLDIDKVDLVFSSYGTNVVAPAMPVIMAKDKVFLSMFCIALNSQFNYPRYFSMHPAGPDAKSAFSEGFFKIAAEQAQKPQSVAVVTGDGEATRLITEGAYENIKKGGFNIVYDQRYPLSTMDFTPIVRAIQAKNPDILFLSSYPLDSVGLLRAVQEIGLKPKLVGGVLNGLPTPVLKAQLGPALNGVINYEFWVPTKELATNSSLELIKRYRTRAKGEGVDPIGLYVPPWAYAYGQVIEQAVVAAGNLQDESIAEQMRKMTFKTVVGEIKFGKDGEWEKTRMLTVQHHSIKGKDIAQFEDMSTMTVLHPSELATGKAIYPFQSARE